MFLKIFFHCKYVLIFQDYITALANFSSIDNPTLLNLPNNIQTVHEQIEANNDLTNLSKFTCGNILFFIDFLMAFHFFRITDVRRNYS